MTSFEELLSLPPGPRCTGCGDFMAKAFPFEECQGYGPDTEYICAGCYSDGVRPS